jgi:hypothetical protein
VSRLTEDRDRDRADRARRTAAIAPGTALR